MEYNFSDIEKKWQQHWKKVGTYQVDNESTQPKCYVLDMFPYPSGAGLHVGHPLGYIASDIYSRYKRLKGFNVLHPMGFDSFGLPAEQYALDTGQHPAETTRKNIATFKKQLDNIGFCYDWSREVQTSNPHYYKWTQWIFLQLFNSYFCNTEQKALPISRLIEKYATKGALPKKGEPIPGRHFTADEWNHFTEEKQQEILMRRRLAYSKYGEVNWCEALGTVLANDEVVNGVSERGGHPVVKKKMRQWYLRITAYANRLLEGLDKVDFSDSMKEMQKNWIGKSTGAEISFNIKGQPKNQSGLTVFTTRPDTIFGVDFMVVAPEHACIEKITTPAQKPEIEKYLQYVKSRSDRERQSEVKQITGCFTGAYALHPFNGKEIPIWTAEYVLAGYGTGAIMAVPCGDERDFAFATHFQIPITNIIGHHFTGKEANPTKEAILENSDFMNGMKMSEAIDFAIQKLEESGIGQRKINYKMHDAGFSRQRYWGEPFPIKWVNGMPVALDEKELPLELPHVATYKPGPEGQGPLANIKEWTDRNLETNTMPGYAGSSWYFLRFMDPHNEKTFCDRKVSDYWNQVDLYIGGTEHAVGHLLYSRMWTKVLYDLGYIGFDEPFKKLLNQGMIQGSSRFVYRKNGENKFISKAFIEKHQIQQLHVDVNLVDGVELNIEAFKKSKPEYANAEFLLEDGKYICGSEVEKMSKSKFNTVNPDDLVVQYGADTFRMYEMFLGPVEMSKPWDTKGIEGVHRFLKKFWRLFADETQGLIVTDEEPTAAEMKILHYTIKKIEQDTERFSFNTAVSTFMIATNELTDVQCHKRKILLPLLILLAPYAPHIAAELYQSVQQAALMEEADVVNAAFPKFEEKYIKESSKNYPVAVNGKMRTTINIALDADQKQVEEIVLQNDIVQKWLDGQSPKKIIYVKNKMINLVI
ncbi:MAG: leucine--tRNA ligase [Chitinophagaceae bacterium]